MDGVDTLEPSDLDRRQQMATARRQREGERRALLAEFVDAMRRADELRKWIGAYGRPTGEHSHSELRRMREWTEAQLKELDLFLEPERISMVLRARELFPEVDPLDDPLGEPPARRVLGFWG
jgi:hypothetical protein